MTPHEVRVFKTVIVQIEQYFRELAIQSEQEQETDEPLFTWPDDDSPCPNCGSESEIHGFEQIIFHKCIVCEYEW